MHKKSAFTMIELVMVIVVMGIVASIGADIIARMYENYIKTRSINKLQAQSEIVLNEISKRLEYRIKDSVIARNDINFSDYVSLSDANDSYQILEWIGKDNDSRRGISKPGWSGFVDLDSNETSKIAKTLKTPGSELNTANIIIRALSYDNSTGTSKVSLDFSAPNRPAIIFRGQTNFDLSQYGWNGTRGLYTYRVTNVTNDKLKLIDANSTYPKEIFEQYDLAWSAYSVVPEGNDTNDFNLTLHYNYQPWEGEKYSDVNGSILAEHVSTFKFTKTGDTIRLKLCIRDALHITDSSFAFCKERVVY